MRVRSMFPCVDSPDVTSQRHPTTPRSHKRGISVQAKALADATDAGSPGSSRFSGEASGHDARMLPILVMPALALGTGVGIVGLIVIIVLVVLIIRIL